MGAYNKEKSLIGSFWPTGSIVAWPSNDIPLGWLKCDGSELSSTAENGKYAALYAIIGTLYGTGSSGDSFKLPDLRARFVEGASSTSGHTVGSYVAASLPDHNHTFTGSSVTSSGAGGHTHTKGSMRIQGSTSGANIGAHQGTQSWSGAMRWVRDGTGAGIASSGGYYGSANIDTNWGGWTGQTSTEGAHSHTATAAGTINAASNSVYGKSSTVQPKALCLNYIIKY